MKNTLDFTTLGFNSQDVVSLQRAIDETKRVLQVLIKGLGKQFPNEVFFVKLIYFDIPLRVEIKTGNDEIHLKFKRRLALKQNRNENGVPMTSDEAQMEYDKGIKDDGLEDDREILQRFAKR